MPHRFLREGGGLGSDEFWERSQPPSAHPRSRPYTKESLTKSARTVIIQVLPSNIIGPCLPRLPCAERWMHLHVLQIITILGIAAVLATAIWLVIIALRREHYTRERFAFAALSGFLGMAVSVLSSLADKETPWAAIGNLARAILKLPAQSPEPPRVADHVLMLLVLGMVALFVVRMYENWGGAISVRQRDKQKYHEPTPLLSEGVYEAKRIIKRDPPLELYAKGPHSAPTMALSAPRDTLAWHLQARDLICLRSPDYEIDREGGWHN